MPFPHVPVGEAEVARLTAAIEFEIRRRETRWHRLASVGIFVATALATLAWLRHVEGDAGYVRDVLGACALAIGFFAFQLRASRRSVHALLHEWQVAHRLAPLVRAEAEGLRLA